MRANILIFSIACLFVSIFAKPQKDEKIDLSRLGSNLYGNPVENNGTITIDPKKNPEESGPYLEGDLLVPIRARNGMKSESLRWKNGEVPYIIRGRYSSSEIAIIQNAFNQFHRSTCIKFVPRRSTHVDYIVIENAQTGCWSSVGRIGGEQKINLQSPGCVTKSGTVVHEMLHALGFLHEQNREERDKFVAILNSNIRSGYEVNFKKAQPGETTGFGLPYDFGSVLHYSQNAFSKNGQPTIQAKTSTSDKMGQREGFSKRDIEKVNKMYKCSRSTAESDPGIMTSTIKPSGGGGSGGFGGIISAIFPNMDEEEMIP